MAYQNVGTPRFFIDHGLWLHSSGISSQYSTGDAYQDELIQLNPSRKSMPIGGAFYINVPRYSPIHYVAYLNHTGGTMYPYWTNSAGEDAADPGIISHINGQSYLDSASVSYDGFSIFYITDNPASSINLWAYARDTDHMGAISIGSLFDMPNAPNLSLTMSREYGGTKEFTTYNGSSMSNTMWNKPPVWGDLGAWELEEGNSSLAKSGRRTWDLKFSFMDDSDLWGSNQSLGIDTNDSDAGWEAYAPIVHNPSSFESGDIDNDYFNYNILTDGNFFSQVWHKTLGGTLPFIFQPDNNNSDPDQYSICKFKNNSLKVNQSAFNVYDISLSIEEVW